MRVVRLVVAGDEAQSASGIGRVHLRVISVRRTPGIASMADMRTTVTASGGADQQPRPVARDGSALSCEPLLRLRDAIGAQNLTAWRHIFSGPSHSRPCREPSRAAASAPGRKDLASSLNKTFHSGCLFARRLEQRAAACDCTRDAA